MNPEQWIEALRVHIESLNSNLEKQIEAASIDRENIRKDGENISKLAKIAQAQSESIGELARITERHAARLDAIEGGATHQ